MIVSVTKQFFRNRFPRQFSFVQARLSIAGVFGLHFTVGTIVLIGSMWLFGGISEDLINSDPLILVDRIISELFRSHANAQFTTVMQFVSALASTGTVCVLFSLAAGVLMYKRRWYWLLELVLVAAGGMLLNLALKDLFDRARPGWADPLMALTGPGFPSGHTMMAALIYGFMAVYLVLAIASWRWRAFIVTATVALVFLVALSRMYLGAHYLSDVLAAMAAGTAWLALCLTAVETWRRHCELKLAGGARASVNGRSKRPNGLR